MEKFEISQGDVGGVITQMCVVLGAMRNGEISPTIVDTAWLEAG